MLYALMSLERNRHSQRGTTVVLISSDGDFAYMLQKLRDIGCKVILIHGAKCTTPSVLLSACDKVANWRYDVLGLNDEGVGDDGGDDDGSGGSRNAVRRIESSVPFPIPPAFTRDISSHSEHGRYVSLLHALKIAQSSRLAEYEGESPCAQRNEPRMNLTC